MIYFDDKKENMRRNQILQILHFGRSSKFHCMETMWSVLKVNRQRLKFVMRRPESKIPTPTKWLISPLVHVIIKICKKHLVLKTNSNINIYNET